MKTLKYLSFLLFAFVLSAGFASCSDDDDVDSAAIVGKWEMTWTEGYEHDLEDPEYDYEWSHAENGTYITFNEDGTGTDGDGSFFYWKVKGDKLSIRYDGDDYAEEHTVVQLDSTDMILEIYECEDGYEYYEKFTFKKVK